MTKTFESRLAPYMEGLVSQKRSNGFSYHSAEKLLKRLDAFCAANFPDEATVTYAMAAKWSGSCLGESEGYHNNRISILRALSVYILSLGKEAYLPDSFFTRAYRPALYIPSKEEVKTLIAAMDKPTSHNKVQKRLNKECRVLFLLYFCCGLRLSEGRLLKRENVDLDNGILTIQESKGMKDRLVYLPQDGIGFLKDYNKWLDEAFPGIPWMFPGGNPEKPVSCSGVESCFNRYWAKLPGVQNLEKHPTPHCLRHAFVVERINEWMVSGIDTNKMLPYLSKYLGHKSPDETYYYYHLVSRAFDVIRSKDSVSAKVIPEVSAYEE